MIPTTDLASQLEQIARRLHSQGYASKLFPAQWAALRYIHSAPVPLRTAIVQAEERIGESHYPCPNDDMETTR